MKIEFTVVGIEHTIGFDGTTRNWAKLSILPSYGLKEGEVVDKERLDAYGQINIYLPTSAMEGNLKLGSKHAAVFEMIRGKSS
jgi:hypothetical protein